MVWNIFCSHLRDVTVDQVVATVVGHVGALRITVPLTGEHTSTANILKGLADAPDTRKQVDKSEVAMRRGFWIRKQAAQTGDGVLGWFGFTILPPSQVTGSYVKHTSQF